jgi:serine/threonine-protein kinase
MIAQRYRLEGRLGSGGMSTVHLAFDERLERLVAVKLLAEHLADDPAFVSRFQREALAAARLIHENIVQVFDSGLDDQTDQHFIVMEYIEAAGCRPRRPCRSSSPAAPASTTRTARASSTAT